MSIEMGRSGCQSAQIEAVKVLADGTRVPLGTIAYWHANPLRRWAWGIKQFFKRIF